MFSVIKDLIMTHDWKRVSVSLKEGWKTSFIKNHTRIKNEKYQNLNLQWMTSAFKRTTNDVKMALNKRIFFSKFVKGKEKEQTHY